MPKSLTRRWYCQSGAVILEATICFPIFLLLLAGTCLIGQALNFHLRMTRTSYEIVRIASATPNLTNGDTVFCPTCTPPSNDQRLVIFDKLNRIIATENLGDYQATMSVSDVPVQQVNNPSTNCTTKWINFNITSPAPLGYFIFGSQQLVTQVTAPHLFPDTCA